MDKDQEILRRKLDKIARLAFELGELGKRIDQLENDRAELIYEVQTTYVPKEKA